MIIISILFGASYNFFLFKDSCLYLFLKNLSLGFLFVCLFLNTASPFSLVSSYESPLNVHLKVYFSLAHDYFSLFNLEPLRWILVDFLQICLLVCFLCVQLCLTLLLNFLNLFLTSMPVLYLLLIDRCSFFLFFF